MSSTSTETVYGARFTLARITIEMKSAFRVGTGEGDGVFDAVFATDANDLPAIPGDSLAGVLRHAYAAEVSDDPNSGPTALESGPVRAAFGYQDGDSGRASRVRVSWAQVHNKTNSPVPFRGAQIESDAVLQHLAGGVYRDHVRIGGHGAVDGTGKFDELVVPAGARFTFEVEIHEGSGLVLDDLLRLLASPVVRIGAGTTRGFGAFDVIRVRARKFDLTREADRTAWQKMPVALHESADHVLEEHTRPPRPNTQAGWIVGHLALDACDTWLFGGTLLPSADGDDFVDQKGSQTDAGTRSVDRFPVWEQRIVWKADRAEVENVKQAPYLVPGSSVKGALRHRTEYHLRKAHKAWLPTDGTRYEDSEQTRNRVENVFGSVRDGRGDASEGRPSNVTVGDVYVSRGSTKVARLQHVGLDRFTQGPLDGVLFSEGVLFGGGVTIEVAFRASVHEDGQQALAAALRDLASGNLALGAGRAHGRFRLNEAKTTWSDGGTWWNEVAR